jgi:hypothetical protein
MAKGVLPEARILVSTSAQNALWWFGFAIGKVGLIHNIKGLAVP